MAKFLFKRFVCCVEFFDGRYGLTSGKAHTGESFQKLFGFAVSITCEVQFFGASEFTF